MTQFYTLVFERIKFVCIPRKIVKHQIDPSAMVWIDCHTDTLTLTHLWGWQWVGILHYTLHTHSVVQIEPVGVKWIDWDGDTPTGDVDNELAQCWINKAFWKLNFVQGTLASIHTWEVDCDLANRCSTGTVRDGILNLMTLNTEGLTFN